MKSKNYDISGRVIILTGACGLLGIEYAKELSRLGAHVVLSDLDFDKCKKLEVFLKKEYGTSPLAIRTNVADSQSVKNMVNDVFKKFSKIDVLINNAVFYGIDKSSKKNFEDYPISLWNKSLEVNLTGMFLCSQEVGKIMKKQKKGSIINISSTYGMVAADQRIYGKSGINSTVAYATTKGAVFNFTRYLASYWNRTGIRVNTLTLGGVINNQDPCFVKKYSYKTMLGRMAKKNEYVSAIVFLASEASSYMTGSNLVIDGGWTAW